MLKSGRKSEVNQIDEAKMLIYRRLFFMTGATIILSASTIIYFNSIFTEDRLARVGSAFELAALTLMPYMISAVVAAITAIAVIALLPVLRGAGSAKKIQMRLREMAAGDLSGTVPSSETRGHLGSIVTELNQTVGELGRHIAQWKVVNRQQWHILQAIRQAAESGDGKEVLNQVGKMEKNWEKIVMIEERLVT